MPELPEAETLARDLNRALTGRAIDAVAVLRPDVLRGATPARLKRRAVGALDCPRLAPRQAVVTDNTERLVIVPEVHRGLLVTAGSAAPDVHGAVLFASAGAGC